MNKTNIQPSFLIKNININELYKQYKQGYFNRPIPKKQPLIMLKKNKLDVVAQPVLPYKSKQISGERYVELYRQCKPIKGGRCQYCLIDFSTDIIGYPISYEEKQLLTNNQFNIKHLFWIEGCFHSHDCCLAYIESTQIHKNNPEFDIKVMFKYMLHLLEEDCKKANDTILLKDYGGSMDYHEWLKISYERTNEVIKIPAQVVYQLR
jgi:hypothetical protein